MNRHHTGMLQARRDLGLEHESATPIIVAALPRLDALERDFAMQLLIPGDIDLAQPAHESAAARKARVHQPTPDPKRGQGERSRGHSTKVIA